MMARLTPTDQFLANQLELGWSAWERKPDEADYEMRGGIVANVEDRPDPDTGEIVRWYELLSFPQGRPNFDWFSEHALDPQLNGLPNTASIRAAIKKLNELVGRARGTFTSDHWKWQDTAFRLMQRIS